MANANKPQRFILMPPRGLTTAAATGNRHLSSFMRTLAAGPTVARSRAGAPRGNVMRVLDSVHENGLKLVEMSENERLSLREAHPGLRIVPEVFYKTAQVPRAKIVSKVRTAAGALAAGITLKVVSSVDGSPVAKADVVAFTDFAQQIGASGKTRADGTVSLSLGGSGRIQRLYVYPHLGFWPLLKKNLNIPVTTPIKLLPIVTGYVDVLQQFRKSASGGTGKGVKVAIVDTGCGPHPDLVIAGGFNAVLGQDPNDFADNGDQHGTHVAGIVGARGTSPAGMRGFAPEAEIRAYRVFAKGQGASNFAIVKAIDRAIADGCDLINMSLGGGPADPATSGAIADARAAGVAVICASANDGENQVAQPAADSRAVAVGAFGRVGTYPAGTATADQIGRRGNPDSSYFVGKFSNYGPEIDLIGPGVGIISTVPANGYAVMDGTSMATPAVTGMIARLLSTSSARSASRNQARSDNILTLAYQATREFGFGQIYEGHGWIK